MDDLDLYADEDLYEDEEAEAGEAEGSNRTFIILVVALGSVLLLAVCVFATWAFWLNPRMTADRVAENHAIEATNEAVIATGTAEAEAAAVAPTLAPTDTPAPIPTDTPRPTATPAPTAAPETPAATLAGEVAEAGTTPRPTATRWATSTPRSSAQKEKVPGTGIGALGASVLAVGLLFLLVVVRRVRRAV